MRVDDLTYAAPYEPCAAADVYAVALLGFEALTGRAAFPLDDRADTLPRRLFGPEPTWPTSWPPAWLDWFRAALAADPARAPDTSRARATLDALPPLPGLAG